MNLPITWRDEYFVSKQRIVLTEEQLKIPGLRVFGHHAKSSAGDPLVLHFHEDAFEFMIVTEGTYSLQASGKNYKVTGGDVFITFPGEIHSSDQMPLALGGFYWFQIDVSRIRNLLYLDGEAADDLLQRMKNVGEPVIHAENKAIRSVAKKAFALASTSDNKYITASYLVILINLIMEHARKNTLEPTKDIEAALSYIMDNYAQEISLEELAGYSNLSVSQFKQKFKSQVGVSPRCFINQQKIEYAKMLLLEGKSKTEIAMFLGFSSSSYFAAVFKKFTSCTPTEYKNKKI